jgi:glycine reductase complex component B subunit alpha and beta
LAVACSGSARPVQSVTPTRCALSIWCTLSAWELATFSSELLGDVPALEGVEVEIVHAREPVRITHVLDAVEPRIRPDGRSPFPTEETAGEGRTHRLEGVTVLTCLDFPAEERPLHEQESLVDMAGPGAELTPFSRTTNVVLTFRPPDSTSNEDLEAWARRTTLEVAESVARPTLEAEPVEVERFELGPADAALPSVAALVQLSDLGPLYYQYVYGVPAGEAGLPREIAPAELLDGAVTCGEYHWAALRNPTMFFQQNRLVRTLYREHGKRLCFAGVVLMRGYEQSAEEKQRAAERAAELAVELGAQGVVLTTDAGGNSHTDVMLTCRACERAGIRTTVIVAEMADPESTSPGLTDWVPEADSIVSVGNAEEVVPGWRPERVLGGDALLDGTSARAAGAVPVRNYLGATNQMGQLALSATTW